MSSDDDTPQETLVSRKESRQYNEVPLKAPSDPTPSRQLLRDDEIPRINRLEEHLGATQGRREAKLGDANLNCSSIIRSAMYGDTLAMVVEKQDASKRRRSR